MLQPHLGRSEHMAGRVQGDAHAVVIDGFAIRQGLQRDVRPQPGAQHALAVVMGQVMAWPARAWSEWPCVITARSTGRQGSM